MRVLSLENNLARLARNQQPNLQFAHKPTVYSGLFLLAILIHRPVLNEFRLTKSWTREVLYIDSRELIPRRSRNLFTGADAEEINPVYSRRNYQYNEPCMKNQECSHVEGAICTDNMTCGCAAETVLIWTARSVWRPPKRSGTNARSQYSARQRSSFQLASTICASANRIFITNTS
ncbi:uncharacterized protein LOC143905794 [Temnothorax americanus]|uniref:uncharacterized protein LOC143905794 n=1 Tax=Temnothorax americanus TaxID=1964332 RepID=UPI0040691D2E